MDIYTHKLDKAALADNFFTDESKSPALNPIEHLWDNLDRRVRRRLNPPNNVNVLRAALLEEWNNIPQGDINKLVLSMRRRCQAVSIAHGGHTRY